MDNTSVVYNMESVIQFQIFFLICSIIYESQLISIGLSTIKQPGPDKHPINAIHITQILIIIHVISFLIHEYSIYEIKHFGQPDIMGVYRAPNEVILKTFELLLICLITGFALMHIIDGWYRGETQYIIAYCQIIDIMLMLITKPYIYFG